MAARRIVKQVLATTVLGLVVGANASAGTVTHVTDNLGDDKDLFTVLESVNAWGTAEVNGSGIFGEIIPRAKLYVTPNQVWSNGAALTDVSSNGVEDIVGGLGGAFAFVVVWPGPLTPGEYDVIIDDDRNGVFNVGVDGGLGLGAEYGFRVAEVPAPPAAWLLGTTLAGLAARRRRRVG